MSCSFDVTVSADVRWYAGPLDIAVVQLLQPPSDLQPLTLGCGIDERAAGCYVAGHALFNPTSRLPPLLTYGNVAQVSMHRRTRPPQYRVRPATMVD
jgi:hypothetical protein